MFFAARRGQLDLAFVRKICHLIIRMEDDPEIKHEAVFWVSRFDSDRAAEFLLEVINEE